jgi:predicted amidohydrolase
MSVRIAVVQPISSAPPDDERNVEAAVRHVERAAAQGAEFVALPESYPGPWRMPATFDPTEAMTEVAQRCGVYVQYGTLEPIDPATGSAYNLAKLATPSGERLEPYRRTYPPGPWIYTGGAYWEFQYVAGDAFPVYQTEQATVGLGMCSEVYVPEVARALALRGAELIFLPAGVDKQRLWQTWRNLIWARAIENLAVVVTTQNLFNGAERGLAMVATPEEIVFESTAPGMTVVDVDLDRCRELRAREDEVGSCFEEGAKAGVLTQWQRPELRDSVFAPSDRATQPARSPSLTTGA